MSKLVAIHGRDHRPGGADPIPLTLLTRYSNEIINDPVGGLVLYWKLDELGNTTVLAVDSSGNGNDGTYGVSTAHPTLGVAALADGTAATFDGSDDIVLIGGPATPENQLCGFGQMSIEFWTKTTATGSGTETLVGSDDSEADGRFFKVVLDTGGVISYIIFDTGASGHTATGSIVVNDGVKHHVVCTFDGTDMKIYVDGVLDTTFTPSLFGQVLAAECHGMSVGSGMPQGGGFFEDDPIAATMDEIALYTIALPLDSVQTHFLIGSQAANPPLGPAGGVNGGNYPDPEFNPSVAGAGLGIDGANQVLSVNVDDATIEIAADELRIKDAGVTADKLEADPTSNDGKWLRLSSGALVWEAISADEIAIADSGGYFTSTDVEGALQELGADAGGGGDATVDITSPAHGFSEGDVIRFDPSSIGGTPTMVASHQTAAVASTSITATIPAGLSAGDVLVLKVDWSGMTGVSAVTCTGFTSIGLQGFDLDGVAVLYRLLDGSEAYITGGGTVSVVASFGSDFGAHMAVFAIGYSGCSPTSPIDTGVLDGSTSPTNNGYTSTYTTVDDDEVIVQALMIGDSGTIGSWLPASGTLQQDSTSVLSSKHVSYYESDLIGTAGSQAVQALWSTAEFGLVKFGLRPHAGGTGYVLAQADNADDAEVLGIVTAVPDADHFTVTLAGHVTTGLSGLTTGTVYFLDPDTAGALTATEPSTTGEVSKPLLIADSSSSGYFFNFRGEIIGGGSNSGSSFAGPTDAAVTAGDVSITDSGGYFTSTDVEGALQELGADAGGSSSQSYAVIEHQTAASVNAGTTVSGTWVTRPLTTEVSDPDGIVSISSNQFTLQPGTYRIEAWSVCYAGDRHKCRIRNITDGVTAIVGSTMYAYSGASGWNKSEADGVIVIAAAKTFELQHYNQTGHGSFGLGYAASVNDGEVEVWAAVKITKTA